jgi:CDP-diglyceride synthetase
MNTVLEMYVTLLPVIFAGVLNMVFVKSPLLNPLKTPMDNGLVLSDGRRLLGANKTWKGFWGMAVLGGLVMIVWGLLSGHGGVLYENNLLYKDHDNSVLFNALVGLALGLAYVVFELPNSFFKRRLDIGPGQTPAGVKGLPFWILDQVDSLFGCVLVVALLFPMSPLFYLAYVTLGGLTHIVINILLYSVKLKREI